MYRHSKSYSKNEIITRICESAKKYKENLLNRNLMFIFENKRTKKIMYMEAIFKSWNFLHLTGVDYNRGAREFFKASISKKLSIKDIKVKNKFFTQAKVEILENVMSINKNAKRIGDYNYNKLNIKIEKVIGNTHCCLGFSKLDSNSKELKYYYPKTLIQDNLKSNIIEDNKIITILSKNKNKDLYNEVTYFSNRVTLDILKKNIDISKRIDYNNIYSSNLNYQKKINEYLKNNN